MAIDGLQAVMQSGGTKTSGLNWHEHKFKFSGARNALGDVQIEAMMKRFFGARSFIDSPDILCWYDEDTNYGPEDFYQCLNGIHLVGALWKKNGIGIDVPFQFFVRKLVNYRAVLRDWRHDIKFPEQTCGYSVCALLPDDFVWSGRGLHDDGNVSVKQYDISALRRYGVNFDVLREWMTYEEFCRDPL